MQPGLHIFGDDGVPGQRPFDVAVVMPTLLRPSIFHALRSVFAQIGDFRVQVMIGLDQPPPEQAEQLLKAALQTRPSGWCVHVLWPGYSTSQRHGGFGKAKDGGVLRSVLSQLSNASRIAYLDDDNWWAPEHLSGLLGAIEGHDWAWSGRWFMHPRTLKPICPDIWESAGPGEGIFSERFGGFVDPNCLMIDRCRVPQVLDLWNRPREDDPTQMTADRTVFAALKALDGRPSGKYSTFYVMRETDGMHPVRLNVMGQKWEEAGRHA